MLKMVHIKKESLKKKPQKTDSVQELSSKWFWEGGPVGVSGCKSRFVPVPGCSSVHLVSDWLKMGHVTQLWPTRSRPERLLGRFSSFLKKKSKSPSVFGIWMLLGKNVMFGAVVAVL